MSQRLRRSAPASPTPSGAFAVDLGRGRWDVPFFCRRFLGFTPHPGQERLFSAYLRRDRSKYRPAYLTVYCSAGNRAGKTLGLAVLILHSAVYKMGLPFPDVLDERALERWMTLAYEWYHFAIQQETAELVYYELVRLLSGTHEAQKNGCPLTDELGAPPADWSKKYRGEYLWIRLASLLGGADIHFRTTSEKAVGSLGKDMHGISFDECAFDPHLDFIVDEVLHLRRLGTGGQLFLISTPTEGINAFSDQWSKGDPTNPLRGRYDFSLRMSTRENIGFGIDQEVFDRLVEGMPEHLIPQNIDGYFLEGRSAYFDSRAVDAMFDASLAEEEACQAAHEYIQGVDPAITFDSTWSIVLDATKRDAAVGVSARRKTGRQTAMSVAAMVRSQHHAYSAGLARCTTAVDVTGFGGKVFRDLLSDVQPFKSVEFGGTRAKKLKLLTDLKNAIERGHMRFPRSGIWLDLRRQLLGYRLEDKNLSTDAVMALAVAVSVMVRIPAGAVSSVPFDYFTPAPERVDSVRVSGRLARATIQSLGAMVERGRW